MLMSYHMMSSMNVIIKRLLTYPENCFLKIDYTDILHLRNFFMEVVSGNSLFTIKKQLYYLTNLVCIRLDNLPSITLIVSTTSELQYDNWKCITSSVILLLCFSSGTILNYLMKFLFISRAENVYLLVLRLDWWLFSKHKSTYTY